MRLILPALAALVFAPLLVTPAKADPYRWCAEYAGGARGGNTSCYFVTYEQCRASVSGVGGFCRVNGFYDQDDVAGLDRNFAAFGNGRAGALQHVDAFLEAVVQVRAARRIARLRRRDLGDAERHA